MSPDVAASVKARLLNDARARGEEFERTLVRFAAERLLFRLSASAARDRCLLKGASLLTVWLPDPYRTTRDVDVLISGQSDDGAIRSLVEEICAADCPEDALRFDLSELVVETIRPEDEYSGKRVRFRAHLGNARIAVQLDLGVGDALTLEGERADAAEKLVRRANRRHQRVKTERPGPAVIPAAVAKLPDPPSPVRAPAT